MTKTPLTSGTHSSDRLFRWLWGHYLKRFSVFLGLALFFMVIEGSMLGALSYIMRPMFDTVFIAGNESAIYWVALAIFGIFAGRAVASVGQKITLAYIVQRMAAALRTDLLAHIMRQDGAFHQTHPPGFLIQRVQADVMAINDGWRALVMGAGRDFITLLVLMGVAVSVDWRWTLVALVGAPLVLAPTRLVQKFVRARAREARDLGARLATRLDEVFHGIVPVKLNRLERYQSERYGALTDKLVKAELRAHAGSAVVPGLIDLMSGLGFVGVLIYGGSEIIAGDKTVGQFMSFFTAIGFAFEPLRRLGAVSGQWQIAASGIERLRELLDTKPSLTSPAKPKPAPKGTPEIRLGNVTLAYGDTTVLKGASLTAEAGKTTALVGASGAGKSTVFNLLTRLVDPDSGTVTVGGVETRDMSLGDLRSLFSVVSQDAALFDETLRENILLGRTDVSEARLKQVIEAAHVADFLPQLSDGLDTPVGPRGSSLSGGQRQRVAIARALLRDTPVLLLDEATSALDAKSEAVVQDALERLSKGRTTLVIAHRLSTVRDAHKIIVMDAGRVVDEGSHEALLKGDGLYARLHDLQFKTNGQTADTAALAKQGLRRAGSGPDTEGSGHRGASSLISRIFARLSGQ